MPNATDHAARLAGAGFTEAQAAAIGQTVHATIDEAVEVLGGRLARWHAYLAMFLLIEIGIVLLAVLMVQAVREPAYPSRAAFEGGLERRTTDVDRGDSW